MLQPINVEFLDAPNILNDGASENTLNIGVFNTALPSAGGAHAADLTLPAGIPMYFWFITDPQQANMDPSRPWGLTSADHLFSSAVKVEATPGEWTKSNHEDVAQRPDLKGYTLTPSKDVVLGPGEHIRVTISGLKCGLPSGPTTPFFSYTGNGINHQAVYGPIQKSPVFTSGQKIGMGTNRPASKLEVQGQGSHGVEFQVNGRMKSGGAAGGMWVDDTDQRFVGAYDPDPANKKIGFYNGGWRLLVDQGGNVGIGTTGPGAQLHVSSNGLSENQWSLRAGGLGRVAIDSDGVIGGRLSVLQNGNVGIGNPNPQSKLEVNGNVKATGHAEIGGSLDIKDRALVLGGTNDWSCIYLAGKKKWQIANLDDQIQIGRWENDQTLTTLFSIGSDGIIRTAANRPFSQTGQVRDGDLISVPYGTRNDWNIFLTPLDMDASQEDRHHDDALLGFTFRADARDDTSWIARVAIRYSWGGGYTGMDQTKTAHHEDRYKRDVHLNYLLVRR